MRRRNTVTVCARVIIPTSHCVPTENVLRASLTCVVYLTLCVLHWDNRDEANKLTQKKLITVCLLVCFASPSTRLSLARSLALSPSLYTFIKLLNTQPPCFSVYPRSLYLSGFPFDQPAIQFIVPIFVIYVIGDGQTDGLDRTEEVWNET